MSGRVSQKKIEYGQRLIGMVEEFSKVLLVHCDNVGSNQMAEVRIALRGEAEVIMGKNTMMRRVLRNWVEETGREEYVPLIDKIIGNVGLVFTNKSIKEIREKVLENRQPAPARAGAIAPCDVFVPPGPTGMDPGQTSFFQAMNIATKIVRGQIEIVSKVHLLKPGDKVGESESSLLAKLSLKPFAYGLIPLQVFEDGLLYDPAVLDLSEQDLLNKFFRGVSHVAAISLEIGYPTIASIPHSLRAAYKKILAIVAMTDYVFEEAKLFKEMLENPEAFAAAAAAAAPAEEVVEEEEEEEEESEEEMGFGGLF